MSFLGSVCRVQVELADGELRRPRRVSAADAEQAVPGGPVRGAASCPPLSSRPPSHPPDVWSGIPEPAREVDVVHETEVLVVGSGPGGLSCGTGLRAGRARDDPARPERLLRREHHAGRGRGIGWYRHEDTVDGEGIGPSWRSARPRWARRPGDPVAVQAFNGEGSSTSPTSSSRRPASRRCSTACAVGPIIEDGVIRGVITESKSGREAILAARVVDATATRTSPPRRGARPQDAARGDAGRVGDVLDDRREQGALPRRREGRPQTYRDWAGNAEWDIETTGKEDELFSPFLRKPFKQAVAAGLIPANLITLAGTWGTISDQGDLTYLNLVHLAGIDGTSADDLTRGEIEGRKQAMHAIDALRAFMPGCEDATLRNFGMTIGIRDTRKIDALYDLTEHDVREQARSTTRSASFPSSSTATAS